MPVQLYDLAIAVTDLGLAFLLICIIGALALLAASSARPRWRCDACGTTVDTFAALVAHEGIHGICNCGDGFHHPRCTLAGTEPRRVA